MRTLLYEYKKTRRELRLELEDTCKPFEKFISQAVSDKDKAKLLELKTELKLIKNTYNIMISNLEYAIDWIEHGREPGKMRGADITKVYLKDPFIIDSSMKYKSMVSDEPSRELTSIEKEMIEDAMSTLSKREKEVYLLYFVDGCSLQKIADLLGVERSTVQTHYERAVKKIEKRKIESLFLI